MFALVMSDILKIQNYLTACGSQMKFILDYLPVVLFHWIFLPFFLFFPDMCTYQTKTNKKKKKNKQTKNPTICKCGIEKTKSITKPNRYGIRKSFYHCTWKHPFSSFPSRFNLNIQSENLHFVIRRKQPGTLNRS